MNSLPVIFLLFGLFLVWVSRSKTCEVCHENQTRNYGGVCDACNKSVASKILRNTKRYTFSSKLRNSFNRKNLRK